MRSTFVLLEFTGLLLSYLTLVGGPEPECTATPPAFPPRLAS